MSAIILIGNYKKEKVSMLYKGALDVGYYLGFPCFNGDPTNFEVPIKGLADGLGR